MEIWYCNVSLIRGIYQQIKDTIERSVCGGYLLSRSFIFFQVIGIKKRRTYSEYLNNPVHMVWVVISVIDYVINEIYGLCCWDGGLGWGGFYFDIMFIHFC